MNLVFAYHCGTPLSGALHLHEEHERCTALWNALVLIDRAAEQAQIDAAAADEQAIAELRTGIATLSAAIQELRAAGQRSKATLAEAVTQRRALYAELRSAMAVWRKAHREKLKHIERERQAAVTRARKASPAWWPNYNFTIQRYDTARAVCRQTGRRLRLHDESRDDGVLAYQIQRTRSGLGAAPSELEDGTVRQLQIGRVPPHAYDRSVAPRKRLAARRTEVEMQVDADGHTVRLPITVHRALPPDARIKSAQLTWRVREGQTAWQLCLTLSLPDVRPQTPMGKPDELVLRWEPLPDGSLLAAELGVHRCVLDSRWVQQMDRVDWLHGLLVDAEDDDPRWHEYQRWLARETGCRERPRRTLRQVAQAHLHGLRGRLLRRRRETYRLWARDVVRAYSYIAVDGIDLMASAREAAKSPANSLRHRVAPHLLRQEVMYQAQRAGTALCRRGASGALISLDRVSGSSSWARRKSARAERSHSSDESRAACESGT